MAVRHYSEFIAWQLGQKFKREVYRIVRSSQEARQDLKFKGQIFEAARGVPHNISEGFLRKQPRVFAGFIDFSLGSLVEAEGRLAEGIELDYYAAAECENAFRLARRCLVASVRLKQSQIRYAEEQDEKQRQKREEARRKRREPPV